MFLVIPTLTLAVTIRTSVVTDPPPANRRPPSYIFTSFQTRFNAKTSKAQVTIPTAPIHEIVTSFNDPRHEFVGFNLNIP